jgi:hypothetical protein
MASSATLMERATPYSLVIELARGKINQVRNHAAELAQAGLHAPAAAQRTLHDATVAFGQALMRFPDAESILHAEKALQLAYQAAHELVLAYVDRQFELRKERTGKIDAWLSCRLEGEEPSGPDTPGFLRAFNAVSLPFSWKQIEPREGQYSWESADQLVNWSMSHGMKTVGGPLIDFTGRNVPDWVWKNAEDLTGLGFVLGSYVENVVRRYQTRVRTWQITAGSNCAGTFACRDEELIWLTLRIADAVRRVNPMLEIVVGIAQPWGDYLADQERSKTPFIFADDLMRTGIRLAALDLEILMGVSPRGSFCRDLLEASRVLDLYALLGVPIQATLAYPSSAGPSTLSDSDQRVNLGHWRDGYSEATQADWASSFAAVALCKPYVRNVQWCHWTDAEPHACPNCGMLDEEGRAKAALAALQLLRSKHIAPASINVATLPEFTLDG